MSDKHRALLEEARGHLDVAGEHLDDDRPGSARRRIGLAKGCIQRAIEGLYVDPTAATGAQTSVGQSPRHASDQQVVERLVTSFRRGAREQRR